MTEPDDLPPVGATVEDALGTVWVRVKRVSEFPRWRTGYLNGTWRNAEGIDAIASLTALFRMQQERDQLKAERDAIMQAYAIESDLSLTECVTRTIDGWRERCETAEARVAKFDALAQEAARRKAWWYGTHEDDGTWRGGDELLAALARLALKVTP